MKDEELPREQVFRLPDGALFQLPEYVKLPGGVLKPVGECTAEDFRAAAALVEENLGADGPAGDANR